MKKVISVLLCIVCLCGFASCGPEKEPPIEPGKQIFLGKLFFNIPDGWVETMEDDQVTFTFRNNKDDLLGNLLISFTDANNPAKLTAFQGEPKREDKQFGENKYIVIFGLDAGAQEVTEYHFMHGGIDYTFIFTSVASKADIDYILNSLETV